MNTDEKASEQENLVAEYRKASRELEVLESNPALIRDRVEKILQEVPRLRQLREGTFEPEPGEEGLVERQVFDPVSGESLGKFVDIEDDYLTLQERQARKKIRHLEGLVDYLRRRVDFLRVKADAAGIRLPEETG